MIHVKHLLDPIDPADGERIWVESIGLTRDLREWCKIDHILCHLGPPCELWQTLEEHPEAWEFFRGRYHELLSKSKYKPALQALACAGMRESFTLVHQCDDPEHNTAAALREFLHELEAWCPREDA